jgi:hypothetical protein
MQKTDSHERRSQKSVQIATSAYLTEARIVKSCQALADTSGNEDNSQQILNTSFGMPRAMTNNVF